MFFWLYRKDNYLEGKFYIKAGIWHFYTTCLLFFLQNDNTGDNISKCWNYFSKTKAKKKKSISTTTAKNKPFRVQGLWGRKPPKTPQ